MVRIGLSLFIKGMHGNIKLMYDAFQLYHCYKITKIWPEKFGENLKKQFWKDSGPDALYICWLTL